MRTMSLPALAMAVCSGSSIGCRTRFEPVVCLSDADCTAEEYFCDTAAQRCVRRMCEEPADCAEQYGYTCDVATQHCVRALDGGPDGSTTCDRDGDGVDGPQCDGDDCDDDDRDRAPGKDETCNNGIDDDCDEATSEGIDADDDDYCTSGGPLPCCAQTDADCCDTDADAHPGQTGWFDMTDGETACSGWDYDCSGANELEQPVTASCMCDPCAGTNGWVAVIPNCGGAGNFAICGGEVCGSCPGGTDPARLQGCH